MTPATQNIRPARSRAFVSASLAALAIAIALVATGCVNNTPADTWVVQNQNPENTRYVGGRITTSTISNVAVGWTADFKAKHGFGAGAPGPLIDKNFVFVEGENGQITAFDRFTGEEASGETIDANQPDSPEWLVDKLVEAGDELALEDFPILTNTNVNDPDDGTSIVVNSSEKGEVVALNEESGDKVWSRQLEAPSESSPRVVSSMAAANNSIFAPVVNVPEDDKDSSLNEVFESTIKAKSSSGSLVSINAENGDVNWTKTLTSAPLGGATVANNIVFVTTVDGNIYGFDRDGGDQVWTSKLPAGSASPIAASDDTVIVPASVVTEKGQKAQVVAFRIGGLGQIGGAEAPKLQQAEEAERAEETEAGGGEEAAAGADGKTIFTANCAGCHTLADAGTSGTVGPNLDDLKPSEAQVEAIVTAGRGAMPSFDGTLSPEEIQAVSEYVSSVAGS